MPRLTAIPTAVIRGPTMVDVICTDNDRVNLAELISHRPDMIVVEFSNGLRLTLYKYAARPGLFVGNNGGLEFQCRPG